MVSYNYPGSLTNWKALILLWTSLAVLPMLLLPEEFSASCVVFAGALLPDAKSAASLFHSKSLLSLSWSCALLPLPWLLLEKRPSQPHKRRHVLPNSAILNHWPNMVEIFIASLLTIISVPHGAHAKWMLQPRQIGLLTDKLTWLRTIDIIVIVHNSKLVMIKENLSSLNLVRDLIIQTFIF